MNVLPCPRSLFAMTTSPPRSLASWRATARPRPVPAEVRQCPIRLPERFEDVLLILGGNSTAGVRHFEIDPELGTNALDPQNEQDVSVIGVLHCIREQIDEDLA